MIYSDGAEREPVEVVRFATAAEVASSRGVGVGAAEVQCAARGGAVVCRRLSDDAEVVCRPEHLLADSVLEISQVMSDLLGSRPA